MEWEQKIQGMAYIGIPYTGAMGPMSSPAAREQSFHVVNKIAAFFLLQGELIYSPITHSHPIHYYMGELGNDHQLWMKYDKSMMDLCNRMYVVCYGEYRKSRGVMEEIEYFKKNKKPVFLLSINNGLTVTIAYSVPNIDHVTFPQSVEDRKAIVDYHDARRLGPY